MHPLYTNNVFIFLAMLFMLDKLINGELFDKRQGKIDPATPTLVTSTPTPAHEYIVLAQQANYTTSVQLCAALGATLPMPKTQAENDALHAFTSGGVDFFLGLSDAGTEGAWLWADGSSVTWSNWATAEETDWGAVPNGGIKENYAIMLTKYVSGDHSHRWQDVPGFLQAGQVVCQERPPESQWVKEVVSFTSQYHIVGWQASQVIGPPDLYPRYGDLRNAWAQAVGAFTRDQGITVRFAHVLLLKEIHVYETFHPGGVVKIYALDHASNEEVLVFETSEASDLGPGKKSRIFKPELKDAAIGTPTRQLRLVVDCTAAGTYVEIDAIKLIGLKPITGKSTPSTTTTPRTTLAPLRKAQQCVGHQWLYLDCDARWGGQIQVQQAIYGNDESSSVSKQDCPNHTWHRACIPSSTEIRRVTAKVKTRCDGRAGCSLYVHAGWWGDVCVSRNKYLKIYYRCVDALPEAQAGPSHTISVCHEGARYKRTITCDPEKGTNIHIQKVWYGSPPDRALAKAQCSSIPWYSDCVPKAPMMGEHFQVVRNTCEGKGACTVYQNPVLNAGDSCYERAKMLMIVYNCY